MANQLSTFDQISITEEGILAAFKYVKLIDQNTSLKKDEKGASNQTWQCMKEN
jgi:hypothetical protein